MNNIKKNEPKTPPSGAGGLIVCFGEMLWDMLPTGKMPGGAPMNVAYHLKNFGFDTTVISRVGHDDLGKELIGFVQTAGLKTNFIQQGETHLTGVVKVNVDDANEISYKIVKPVAWDYIMLEAVAAEAVAVSDAFVFGTLSARSEQSFETLKKLLELAPLKVLDVNFRPPYYDQDTVEYLLSKANIVKMNHHELAEISNWFFDVKVIENQMEKLADKFNLQTVCVTCGSEGAMLLHKNIFYKSNGFRVTVIDTIGSGDSFLSALLKGLLNHEDISETLTFACATGAYVATQKGATPTISENTIRQWMSVTTT